MTLLMLSDMCCTQDGRQVLDGINLSIAPGEFVGLIGRNGAGKTTLLRASLGLIPAQGWSSLADMSVRERARAAAFMPQGREIAWPMPVESLVALGRIAHPDAASASDRAATEQAIAALELQGLRHRAATSLSGGEQARVLIARALAQDTPLLMADEPIAGLDPAAQISVMRLFAGLAAQGKAVLASLHDLGLAARHCTRLILLDHGRIVADGPPAKVLTAGHLAQSFGITAQMSVGPEGMLFQVIDTASSQGAN
ncbi:ABC transporter ATP-binding protein [Paracoccus aestuariivivens]|uniref:ATP-binding cassette domain-containing protein n=1 Tax=Paracoccus aestuariivivens TaxID=1820333 RepID=A0A6L6J8N9_9RHOB|nr:ABC transporter ATP-binding protein [Paracoccus aestuariivivens]MTH76494.1 ATP-binding cassette domain-containing protein [Paracoccus aestuariivivens]